MSVASLAPARHRAKVREGLDGEPNPAFHAKVEAAAVRRESDAARIHRESGRTIREKVTAELPEL